MVNKTVTQEESGQYFHSRTKRKQTCSAVIGDCVRNTVPSKGRSDCATKCINNTEEVRKALGGRRCLAYNFSYKDRAHDNSWENPREDNSAFCEVSSRAYWSGQWHGSGIGSKRRYTARIKDDRPNRPTPEDKRKGCYAEVYEERNQEHWNHTASEGKDYDFEDWNKNRSKSVSVKGCVGNAAVSFWDEGGNRAFLTTDGDLNHLGLNAAENKIAKVKFHEIKKHDPDTELREDITIFGLTDSNNFDNPDSGVIIDKSRRDKIPLSKKLDDTILKGDPCPGGEMYWKDANTVRCIYKKADFDSKATELDTITSNEDRDPRKYMYEKLVDTYCEDTDNFYKVIGKDNKKCSQRGEAKEQAYKYCSEDIERMGNDKKTCNLDVLGQANFDDLGTMYCEKHPENNFCNCYNTLTPDLCDNNPDAAGCKEALDKIEGMKDLVGERAYSLFKQQKQCFVCPSSEFIPENALEGCSRNIQICGVPITVGQATGTSIQTSCNFEDTPSEPSTDTDADTGSDAASAGSTPTPSSSSPSSTPSPTPSGAGAGGDDEDEDEGLSMQAKIGIGLGVLIFVILIIFALMMRR